MQNANIRYVIRIEKGVDKNREVEINIKLSDFDTGYSLDDALLDDHDILVSTWGSEYYTVMEREIELFND